MLRQLRWSELSTEERARLYARGTADDLSQELRASIRGLVDDVRLRGDAALVEALQRFDGVSVEPSGLRVTDAEFEAAEAALDPALASAIDVMIANIRAFNEELLSRRTSWRAEISPGHVVGEQVGPVTSAALFCPSGKASYPSVLAQIGTPAIVAGVERTTVVVPPIPGSAGEVDPAVLGVARRLGISEVFRVNGPAGVAAAAFGTESIAAHGMVIGPGSPAVSLAQLEVRAFGIDSVVMGPTESLVIADGSANISHLAADLLNEAEHGTDSTVVLVTADESLLGPLTDELVRQRALLPMERREATEAALGINGGAVVVDDMDEAVDVANWFAAEHCLLAVEDPEALLPRIEHAGEILLGPNTPFSVGNFTLGGPAALPTGGQADRTGGITVETFLKSSAFGKLSKEAFAAVDDATVSLANHEGFPAHANAIDVRR